MARQPSAVPVCAQAARPVAAPRHRAEHLRSLLNPALAPKAHHNRMCCHQMRLKIPFQIPQHNSSATLKCRKMHPSHISALHNRKKSIFIFSIFLQRSILYLFCLSGESLVYSINMRAPVVFHMRLGSHVHFCPRPRSEHVSTGQASHPPTRGTRLCVSSVLSCPLWPCTHRMCVIAKRLGSLHWLAHAARHGHFQGVFTSRRTVSSAQDR